MPSPASYQRPSTKQIPRYVCRSVVGAADPRGYWLTRLLLERSIGVICLIAFLVALN